uniref:CD209 antigen-like protein D n=1 Tax=Ciona intestinalis TaxID=7719 RepID=UPI000EF4EE50|nr:CD209 antigen-like protein D [Ciona intestinalis]|eukprot:XP_026693421.1 CD209 antigen-like protein D [Ciona intestinalis]
MVVYDAVIVLDHQMDKLYFVLFVFLVGGARATGSEDMQPVWHELGAWKYYIHNGSRVTYHNATIACESMDAKLAQIKTQEVQTFLEKLIPKGTSYRDAWFIGLKRMRNSSFHWDDGTMVSPGYANWDHKEPNNSSGDEYCVEIRSTSNYKWNDIPCHQKRYYICQRKAGEYRMQY